MSLNKLNDFVIITIVITAVYTLIVLLVAKFYKKELSWNFLINSSVLIPVNLFVAFKIFLLAVGKGNTYDLLYLILFLFVAVITFIALIFIKKHKKDIKTQDIVNISFLVPTGLFIFIVILSFGHDFFTTPMKVDSSDLKGDYVINTEIFKGQDSDWQYQHYWLNISDDTLSLHVMDQGELIKTYKRKIYKTRKKKHDFIKFYDEFRLDNEEVRYVRLNIRDDYDRILKRPRDTITQRFESVNDSVLYSRILEANEEEHHMLKLNPLLHADPFMFNVVLRSTKYGNMFFRKGKWKSE